MSEHQIQTQAKPESTDQPWYQGLSEDDIIARCPGASIEYKEGEMIVTGRPWNPNTGTLYDTKEGGSGGQPKEILGDAKKGIS